MEVFRLLELGKMLLIQHDALLLVSIVPVHLTINLAHDAGVQGHVAAARGRTQVSALLRERATVPNLVTV